MTMSFANMLGFLFLAIAPLLSSAQQIQQPLQDHPAELVISLKLSHERTYIFESAIDGPKVLSSMTVADIESYPEINFRPQTAMLHIPLDASDQGSMILGTVESSNARIQKDIAWIDTMTPGQHMPVTHVGIRKGAMISKDAYSARLALETPYISLPGEIYDILIQATNPTPQHRGGRYDDAVDCDALDRYPDLVLGLEPEVEGDEDEEVEGTEIVITPKQYVLKTKQGRCILLARRSYQRGREEIVLGWAAVRGRGLVLDWVNERIGFGS